MRAPLRFSAVIALALALDAGGGVRVREMHVQPLAARDAVVASSGEQAMAAAEPSAVMSLYPVAGSCGHDIVVPYFVDLDASPVKRDWNCGDLTFNGHQGHDVYLRSFSEQRIGVPLFTPRDGIVIDVRDGEPDENTANDPSMRANYVTIRHDADEITQYVHLRKGIPVAVGQLVTEGTQIGWVGSSGRSVGPHVHFEARVGDVAYEPMAGPCRAGRSYFCDQPEVADRPSVLGVTYGDRSFADFARPPHDDAPRKGTFLIGTQTVWFKAEVANVGASTRYRLLLEKPDSSRPELAAAGVLQQIDVSLASVWWGVEIDFDRPGTWAMVLEIDDRVAVTAPFTVVTSTSQVRNRAPNDVAARLEPLTLRVNQAAVCRVVNGTFADPDYDVVRYRYEWRVNDTVVRDVTTAARSDTLARQYLLRDSVVSCSITPTDGSLTAGTATVYGTPVPPPRRRAVR